MQTPSFTTGDLNLIDRLVRVFYDPQTSFDAVRERETSQDWFAPVALAILVGLAYHFSTIDIPHDPHLPAFQEKLSKLSQEEREKALDALEASREHSWMRIPVVAFMSLVVMGAILMAMARSVMQAEVSFRQMLVVKGYASMVLVPEWIVGTMLVLSKGSPDVQTGPGIFVTPALVGTFVGNLMMAINLFDIWQGYIIGLGVATMADASRTRALVTIFALYAIWIIAGAAVETVAPRVPLPTPEVVPPPVE